MRISSVNNFSKLTPFSDYMAQLKFLLLSGILKFSNSIIITIFFIVILFGFSSTNTNAASLAISSNALEIRLLLSQKLNSLSKNFDQNELNEIISWAEQICSDEIRDSSSHGFDYVLNEIEKSNGINEVFNEIDSNTKNNKFEIVINELRFRILVAIQQNLETAYQSLSAKQKFSNGIAFASINSEISETKTTLLNHQLGIYPTIINADTKKRCWLAIKKMLDEIDIEKSESGNQIVQRSPYGIIITKSEIYNNLNSLAENESDEDVKEYAEEIIEMIKSCDTKYKEFKSEIFLGDLTDLSTIKTINEEALSFFNKAAESLGNNEKIDLYTKAIKKDSAFTAAYNNRGICLFQNNDFQSAINDFNKVIEIDSARLDVYVYIGNGYLRMGNYESAIINYTKALRSNFPSASIHNNRGLCYHKLEKYDQAIEDYTKAIKQDSSSVSTFTNRALCFLATNNYDKAITDYKILTKLDPDNSTNYYNLGCIYWKKQDWNKVVQYWEKGLEIDPSDENILKNLSAAKKNIKE